MPALWRCVQAMSAGEKDAESAQKLGQLQPFSSCIPTAMHGPTCIVWADLTPFSLRLGRTPMRGRREPCRRCRGRRCRGRRCRGRRCRGRRCRGRRCRGRRAVEEEMNFHIDSKYTARRNVNELKRFQIHRQEIQGGFLNPL